MRETEEQPGEEGMSLGSERKAFPRRIASGLGSKDATAGWAGRGKRALRIWYSEQGDGEPISRWVTGVVS